MNAGVVSQFFRFVLVGVSNTAISFVAYTALVWAGVAYWVAGAIAFMFGAANGYFLNRRWTFVYPDSSAARLRYVTVQLAGLGATTALLWLFVWVGIDRIAAYAMTLPVITVATFIANRYWTFR